MATIFLDEAGCPAPVPIVVTIDVLPRAVVQIGEQSANEQVGAGDALAQPHDVVVYLAPVAPFGEAGTAAHGDGQGCPGRLQVRGVGEGGVERDGGDVPQPLWV